MSIGTSSIENAEQITQTKLRLMRDILQRHQHQHNSSSSQEFDDMTLRRFLRAREMDVERGSNMFIKYVKWRETFVPNDSISTKEVFHEISHNKVFFSQGFDKQGRPIAVVFGARHFQIKDGLQEFKRFVVYVLDKLCEKMEEEGQEKFVGILDLKGWGYSNSDVRGYIAALSILQDYYPERLGKLFVVHSPYIFTTVWKAIYPFIDQNTRQKIVFVEDKKLKSTLLEDIDQSQIPDIYGGHLPLLPIQQFNP